MVDINLIGDDKTGEEERVEEFTQTSSMDTQELAFEERTETFDTTKTASLTRRRNYSSFLTVLLIVVVIGFLGYAIYSFMFSEPDTEMLTQDLPAFDAGQDDFQTSEAFPEDQSTASSMEDLAMPEFEDTAEPDFAQEAPPQTTTPQQTITTPAPKPETTRVPLPRTQGITESLTPVTTRILTNSRSGIRAVSDLMSSVPQSLSTTLVSYAGQHMRIEYVSHSESESSDFSGRLNQHFASGSMNVHKKEVANNSGFAQSTLVSGRVNQPRVNAGSNIDFLTSQQAQDWIKTTARQFNLSLRQLRTQQSSFVEGYQRTPIFLKLYGTQGALMSFLEEAGSQNMNMELAKILLVSPDYVNYSDDNLVLVLNMYLYEK